MIQTCFVLQSSSVERRTLSFQGNKFVSATSMLEGYYPTLFEVATPKRITQLPCSIFHSITQLGITVQLCFNPCKYKTQDGWNDDHRAEVYLVKDGKKCVSNVSYDHCVGVAKCGKGMDALVKTHADALQKLFDDKVISQEKYVKADSEKGTLELV